MPTELIIRQINNSIAELEHSLENRKDLLMLLTCNEVKAILSKLHLDIKNGGGILEVWSKDLGEFKYYGSHNRKAVIIFDGGIHIVLQKNGRRLKTLHPFTAYDCIKYLKAIADGKDVALI